MSVIEKIFGSSNSRDLKKIEKIVNSIELLDSSYSKLSDSELQGKTIEFKERISKGESLDSILPEAFATVREASWRVLGLKHFPVQLMGGVALHQGKIAEMKTGEGKANPIDTPIPTPDGWKTVGDIKVGDYLFDRYGKPTKVLGVYPQGVIDTYEVSLRDGRKIKCAGEHLWSVYRDNTDIFETLTTELLMENIKKYRTSYSLPLNSSVKYCEQNLLVDPYILGFNSNLECIPNEYKLGSVEQRWSLVQGLMDINGSIDCSDNGLTYITNNFSLCTDFMEVIYSLGYSCELLKDDYSLLGVYKIKIYAPNKLKYLFFKDDVKKSIALGLKNKKSNDDYSRIFISNICKLEEQTEQVCFVVDNPEHLFLIGKYVVTHNTLVSTCPAYLNALSGNGSVFVVTVNDYLAKRDSQQMGKVFNYLGLTTGLILHDMTSFERKLEYSKDIVYITNNELGFDYLRDRMVYHLNEMVQHEFKYCIVDEIDSILIDEARTPLIISGFGDESVDGYERANIFVRGLRCKKVVEMNTGTKVEQATAQILGNEIKDEYADYDYIVEEKKKSVMLTERGIEKAEKFYNVENLSDASNLSINHYITRALKAYGLFNRDVDYVIKDGKVVIVDESTGRLMDGRRYSEGIHQAIEAKEGVEIQKDSKTLASITFQNLFRKFTKLSGMTGTAYTEKDEFKGIYKLDVVQIPTNKPIQRIDKADRVYITRQAKLKAIVERVKECQKTGQPILVGTVSVERSEELSRLLKKEGISHTVLNAKYHEQEAHIIAQAGKLGSVTIATNMAGRGTDIILGGNPEYLALEELKSEGYSEELLSEATSYSNTDNEEILNIRKLYKEKESEIKKQLAPEVEKVKEVGGLYILGSERHESRRIDNQLRGRSGRQGDVGVSEFMLSLEDDLMRLFGSHKLVDMCKVMKIPDNVPIDMGILSNSVEKAQKKIESQHYSYRKQTLEYDDVLAKQRDIIYEERFKLLDTNADYIEMLKRLMRRCVEEKVNEGYHGVKISNSEIREELSTLFGMMHNQISIPDKDMSSSEMIELIWGDIENKFKELCTTSTPERIQNYSRKLMLFLLDHYWQDHMETMEELKRSIGLRAIAQVEPLQAYKQEGFEMFDEMLKGLREEALSTILSTYYVECIDKPNKLKEIESVIQSVKDGTIDGVIIEKESKSSSDEFESKNNGVNKDV